MTVKEMIHQGNTQWIEAFKNLDYKQFTNLFLEDGAILRGQSQIIEGKDAIRAYIERSMIDLGPTLFEIETLDIYEMLPDIYEKGKYTMTSEDGTTYNGHYIVVWRYNAHGQLKIYRDIGV